LSKDNYKKFKTYLNDAIKTSVRPLVFMEVKKLLSGETISGRGKIKRKSRAKAKAKSKVIKNISLEKAPTIPQTMPPTGLQPQQYRQPIAQPSMTPQMTQQLAHQVAEQIRQQQPATMAPAAVAPAATGSGKPRKARGKATSKIKAMNEKEITVIKPPKTHLDYYDALNDGFLIRSRH